MSEWVSILAVFGFFVLMATCIIIGMAMLSCVDASLALDDKRLDHEHSERMARIAAGIDPDAHDRGKPHGGAGI